MDSAMESWMERASRGAMHIGTVVLLVCLTLSSSMPAPTFNAVADDVQLSSPHHHELAQTHKPPSPTATLSTELAIHDSSSSSSTSKTAAWDGRATKPNFRPPVATKTHRVENTNSVVLSTVQTSEEDIRISTRKRRMSNERSKQYSDITKQLYSRTGFWLAIYDNETINGTHDKNDAYTHLRVTTESWGKIKIRGVLSGMYVCMNRHGRLYPWPEPREECKFQERLQSSFYAVFSSTVHRSLVQGPRGIKRKAWYIGLNTNGKPRLGHKTKHRQIMAQFLLEPVNWNR